MICKRICLLAILLAKANALTTITTTTTFFVVGCTTGLKKPLPTGVPCGVNGTLKSPSLEEPAYVVPSSAANPFLYCRNACLDDSLCVSFAFQSSNGRCSQYNESLQAQGLQHVNNMNGILHYGQRCFSSSCTTKTSTETLRMTVTQSGGPTTSTVPSSSITSTFIPPPPLSTSTSSSIGPITGEPPPPPQTTTMPTATTTGSVGPPSCTDIYVPNVGCFLSYYYGSGYLENNDNPGNTGAPPLTSYISGSDTVCSAANACADLNNSTNPYYSFALYYLYDVGYWQCTRYYGINDNGDGPPAQFFNVSDSYVLEGYGYNLYTSCL